MAYKIGGDDGILSVLEDALVVALSGLLDDVLDFLVGGALIGTDHEINDGDINSGNAECETAVKGQR